jgi:hypothetical protein
MSPFDDPAVSAGEIADYLHSQQSTTVSFTSPPDLAKLGLPQTLAQPLTKPDTSADIIQPRKLGTVNCINVARLGEPITLRYFGASALCSATGQAHPTQAQAEADVLAWADGKQVPYEQHAVVPMSCMATCTKKLTQPASAHDEAKRLLTAIRVSNTKSNATVGQLPYQPVEDLVTKLLAQLTPGSPTERAPTTYAYEQACAALEKHRQRADAAEPWALFFRDGKTLGEIAAAYGQDVYGPAVQPIQRAMFRLTEQIKTTAKAD